MSYYPNINYSNPYSYTYPYSYGPNSYSVQNIQPSLQQVQQPTYMINVDGENAAKSWQPTTMPQPNTIIPLFDSDGEHVYFKTFDAYGRMNPIRKGRIVFDDEIHVSEEAASDMSGYVTKQEIDEIKEELDNLKESLAAVKSTNQNRSNTRGEK